MRDPKNRKKARGCWIGFRTLINAMETTDKCQTKTCQDHKMFRKKHHFDYVNFKKEQSNCLSRSKVEAVAQTAATLVFSAG